MNIINFLFQKVYLRVFSEWLSERKKKRDYKYLLSHGVETEYGNVILNGLPIISMAPNSHIIIGKGVTLVSDTNCNLAGINHPCILSTVRPNSKIIIGDGCGLSGVTISCANQVVLKKGVGLGANVCVFDHDFHGLEPYNRCRSEFVRSSPIIIDDFAWIGANSMVLKGVNIGKAAVVGASSVLTSMVPELSVYAGNPAKFIKKIDIDDEKYKNMYID